MCVCVCVCVCVCNVYLFGTNQYLEDVLIFFHSSISGGLVCAGGIHYGGVRPTSNKKAWFLFLPSFKYTIIDSFSVLILRDTNLICFSVPTIPSLSPSLIFSPPYIYIYIYYIYIITNQSKTWNFESWVIGLSYIFFIMDNILWYCIICLYFEQSKKMYVLEALLALNFNYIYICVFLLSG